MTLLNEYKDTGRLNVQTACIFIAYAENARRICAGMRIQALSLIRPKVQYRPQRSFAAPID